MEYSGRRFLFDCGLGSGFMRNARRLGISLGSLDAVIISHSHYDHAAGFRDLAEAGCGPADLYIGKGFFSRKYSRHGIAYADLSAGWDEEFAISHGFAIHCIDECQEILPGFMIHRGFPRNHPEETIPGRFVKETSAGMISDDFADEIAVSLETSEGIAIITGCSHPGILNITDEISRRTGKKICAVFGGMHLAEADQTRIRWTLSELAARDIGIIGMCHCSGAEAEAMASSMHRDKAAILSVGDTIFLA